MRTDGISNHEVYTVGGFKDDALQSHRHLIAQRNDATGEGVYGITNVFGDYLGLSEGVFNARIANVTRGKRKGVIYLIKVL